MAQNEKSEEELLKVKGGPTTFGGVEQSEEMLRWIWENFSAVSGDQPSFECWRMFPSFAQSKHNIGNMYLTRRAATRESYALHEVLLGSGNAHWRTL